MNSGANKFGPNSEEGWAIGYVMGPGGKWMKDYWVINLEAYRNNPTKPSRTVRVGDVKLPPGPPVFPAKEPLVQSDAKASPEAKTEVLPPPPPAEASSSSSGAPPPATTGHEDNLGALVKNCAFCNNTSTGCCSLMLNRYLIKSVIV